MADDICCQLARQSSKGTFTNSWLWHCQPQLTGVSRARARWLNSNSARGMSKSHQQSDPYYCSLYVCSCLGAFSWCNQTTNNAGIFLPPCQTELTETSWGFERSQSIPQLIPKQVSLARGPVRCYSIIGTWLCSQPAGPSTHLHPPPSLHSWCCSQRPGRDMKKGMEECEKGKGGT